MACGAGRGLSVGRLFDDDAHRIAHLDAGFRGGGHGLAAGKPEANLAVLVQADDPGKNFLARTEGLARPLIQYFDRRFEELNDIHISSFIGESGERVEWVGVMGKTTAGPANDVHIDCSLSGYEFVVPFFTPRKGTQRIAPASPLLPRRAAMTGETASRRAGNKRNTEFRRQGSLRQSFLK